VIAFGVDLHIDGVYFSSHEISELRRPIAEKFCAVMEDAFDLIIPVQNFGRFSPKKFRGQKHAKFGAISDDFKLWRRISLKRMKLFKIGQVHFVPRFLLQAQGKKSLVNFGPQIAEI